MRSQEYRPFHHIIIIFNTALVCGEATSSAIKDNDDDDDADDEGSAF